MKQGYPMLPPGHLPQVNDYQHVEVSGKPVDIMDETEETATDSTHSQHPIFRRSSTSSKTPLLEQPERAVDAQETEEPDAKRARVDDGDGKFLDFEEDSYVMTIDLDLTSHRQKKMFLYNILKPISSRKSRVSKCSMASSVRRSCSSGPRTLKCQASSVQKQYDAVSIGKNSNELRTATVSFEPGGFWCGSRFPQRISRLLGKMQLRTKRPATRRPRHASWS